MPNSWWKDRAQYHHYEWDVLYSTHDWSLRYAQRTLLPGDRWISARAQRQSLGHGKWGRPFISPLGGLYASWICLWPCAILSPLLSLVAALAVVKCLGAECAVKWMNDIVLGEKKVGGVLIEQTYSGANTVCIVSVGLNVNTPLDEIVCDQSTSSLRALGLGGDISELWQRIQRSLFLYFKAFLEDASIIQELNHVSYYQGEGIYLKTRQGWFSGTFHGVTPQGAIRLGQDTYALSLIEDLLSAKELGG